MPGDNINNIGYLDVQFGALDFGTEDCFDNLSDKFGTSVSIDGNQQQQQQSQQPQPQLQQQSSSAVSATIASVPSQQVQKVLVAGGQDVVASYDNQSKMNVVVQQQQQVSQQHQHQQQQSSLKSAMQATHLVNIYIW